METIAQLFRIFWAPRKTLREISQRPRIIAPLVLLTLFAGVETAIVFSTLDPGELRLQEFQRGGYADQISDSDKVIHAQAARNNRGFAATVTAVRSMLIVVFVAGLFFACLGLRRGVPFKSFLAVTAFAFIPGVFHSLAIIATVLTAEPTVETLQSAGTISPILFLDPSSMSRVTYLVLGMIDAVSIWILALLIIGYGFILRDRVSPALRTVTVVGFYCVWSAVYVAIRYTFT
jgi:hypothetical protein